MPHDGPRGLHGIHDSSAWALPYLGASALLVLLLAAALLFLLWRRGRLPMLTPPSPSAEFSAKQILAERMARGELSTEEFLDRASALNWTPGVEPVSAARRLRQS